MTIRRSGWLLSVWLLICCCKANGQRTLPNVSLKQLNGSTTDLALISNDGKPIILFAWEVTCQPCLNEFNNIAKVYPEWKKETGVRIIAISVDDNRSSSRVKPLCISRGWGFDVFLDPNQAFKRAMNIPFCPYVFVLDAKREVVWQKGAYTPGDEQVIYEVVRKVAQGEKIN